MKFPRWLSWMFVAVLVYMIYAARSVETISRPLVQPINEQTYPALAEATDLERWKRAINPDYAAVMNCTVDAPKQNNAAPLVIVDEQMGEGEATVCGERYAFELTVWDAKGVQQFKGKVELALGSRDLSSGLDKGLVGIKSGGIRLLVLPAYARVHAKSKPDQEAIIRLRKLLQGEALAVVRAKRIVQGSV